MKHVHVWIAGVLIAMTTWAQAVERPLPRSTPESQGASSDKLLSLITELDDQFEGMHSLMIVRHGQVIVEGWWKPYDAEHNHVLYSLSKSFTSTAVGLAAAEGKVTVDDVVVDLFPDDAPSSADANLKAMRVRDLLTMSTGHQNEPSAAADTVSAKTFLAHPVPHLPGTHFMYNTAATFLQSAIVQKVTGQSTLDYLRPRLFEPLGIEHPVWDTNFQGISLGGYGLRIRTEDIAKLGQLYLQKGQWNGQQLIPTKWVEMATSKQVSNGSNPNSDWNQGYGFQFWRCRHNAFRGDGAFGQYCVVLPDEDTVVAITSGVSDMQAVLNVLWDKLLPALESKTLPANSEALNALRTKLTSLSVTPIQGAASSPIAQAVLNQRYALPENDLKFKSVTLQSSDDGKRVNLSFEHDGGAIVLPAGYQQWRQGRSAMPVGRLAQFTDEPVAGSFAWSAEDEAVIKVCATETPFHQTYTLKFADDTVTVDVQANVGFGAKKAGPWVGRRLDSSATSSSTPVGSVPEVVQLYDGPAPGSENWTHHEKVIPKTVWGGPVVSNVVHPTLTVVRPKPEIANGTAVVVCPGGGFFLLSIDSEGMDVAHALADKGATCFVLRYRLVETKTDDPARELMSRGNLDPIVKPIVPLALADAQTAIAYIRKHAAKFGVNPQRIGILGFSAGGTVASSAGYNYTTESRPNFVAPIYPAYSWTIKDQGVPADAPPLFVLTASDDPLGLASQSMDLYSAWLAAKKPAELHLLASGGHGFGMNTQHKPTDGWINRFTDWLDYQGLLNSR